MFSFIWHKKAAEQIPVFKSAFNISYILPILWIEHCMECAAPLCYSSCKLYKPRSDGRCLRFENGVAPYDFGNGIIGGQVEFRRWAKIQAKLPKELKGISVNKNLRLQKLINKTGLFFEKLLGKVTWYRHRPSKMAESLGLIYTIKRDFKGEVKAVDGFLITVYSHQERKQKFLIEIEHQKRIDYKNHFLLNPGWNEKYIPLSEMRIDSSKLPFVRLYLDNNDTGKFTFMYLDFVSLITTKERKPAAKAKCVAWDLDNTLWEGIIGDTGDDDVKPNGKVLDIIKQFDKRGILQTIVSKNDYGIAWQKIVEIGISDYFLYPAINWGRKSQNLLEIAKELNISVDTFALIDDLEFERKEVVSALPEVRTYDVTDLESLLSLPEFDVPITEESSKRRLSYLTEYKRKNILASYGDDYNSFLKDCQMKMVVFRPEIHEDRERCLELLQRSNQYNVSKEKRTEDDYFRLYEKDNLSLYGLRVKDRYGDYGIVGFVSIYDDNHTHHLQDFVMSCRVAQKKVERAFFNWLVGEYNTGDVMNIDVYKTDRNIPLREELKKMPFNIVKDSAEKICFSYQKGLGSFIDDDIIDVNRV